MTHEELKKKILEIFEKAIGDWYEKDDGLFAEGYTPEEGDNRLKAFMADALIAAGIGDISAMLEYLKNVKKNAEEERKNLIEIQNIQLDDLNNMRKEAERKAFVYSKEIAHLEKELKQAEHYTKVLERALRIACGNMIKELRQDWRASWRACDYYYDMIKQAEKELAEERKDEQ